MIGRITAMARRELASYLLSPSGYVIIAVFVLFSSLLLAIGSLTGSGFSQGAPASLRLFFTIGVWVFLFVAPAISMRSISEELRSGTFETLMTSPISETQIVLGKFIGAMGFLVIMLLPTMLYVLALELYGRPDYGEIACGYAGLLLTGAAYLATGLLVSTLSPSQVVTYLVTLFAWLVLLIATMGTPVVASMLEGLIVDQSGATVDRLSAFVRGGAEVLAEMNPNERARGFGIGLLDTFNVVFFLSLTAIALVAATKTLEVRRWR